MSEWLLFSTNSVICQLYHDVDKLIFHEMLNNSSRIDMSPHSGTLSLFRDNLSWLFLLNDVCLEEKQQIPML